ncbi:hypothetical protein [Streptomyces sp. NPDC000229]|uniref:hypothetical protein n=1 Tax=Streptomyces sp. NPDC000229 TaxID=3154247 RepID=UPI0033222222
MDEQHDQAVGAGSPILHVRWPRDVDPELYRLLLGLVADVTPVVQALPPSAAVADVSGSLRFFDLLWGFRTCGVTSRSALR